MDLTGLFMFGFISLVTGAVLMLIVQYYIYVRFCDLPTASEEQKTYNEKYALPEDIHEHSSKHDPESKSPLMALNLVMQFLFHEVKHTGRVRKWFYRKLSMELDELVTKTTTGKLFDKLTLKHLDLGDQFPEIKILRVHDVEIHESEGRIENLDLLLEIKYTGNFRLAIDADMVLGKKASLTLKVKRLLGLARLQFTRKPFTHWSLSFLGDPELDLGIESKFQGRPMQSNISSLISNQIRRAVRRKHTLPKYKIRFKPFFHTNEEDIDGEIQPNGSLQVKISELSRLLIPDSSIADIFCTLIISPLPWVEAKQKDDFNILVTIDVKIHKAKNQQIGILFRQGDIYVEIEAVLPNTPAIMSDLKSGDTLVSIEGMRVNSIQQVAKIVKGLNKTVIVLQIERLIQGIIRDDALTEDLDIYEDLGEPKPLSKPGSTAEIHIPTHSSASAIPRQVRGNSSSESSVPGTPTNSPKKSKLIANAIKRTITSYAAEQSGIHLLDDSKSVNSKKEYAITFCNYTGFQTDNESIDFEQYQQHSTIDCPIDQLIHMNELCRFDLNANSRYLNLCVYGRHEDGRKLLGFLNIPIKSLLAEYSETSLIELVKIYHFKPPVMQEAKTHYLSSLSGFNPELCFGDIVMAFSWDGLPIHSDPVKKLIKTKSCADKVAEEIEKSEVGSIFPKTHSFVRTHFHRATQCDFCGKKIWLKDAVQCRDCSMSCHKKCVTKCQSSTVCGPVDCTGVMSTITNLQPEFTVTEAPSAVTITTELEVDDHKFYDPKTSTDAHHRKSLTVLIAQGLKRVNSANNLSIPCISAASNQNSKSLPPSPQYTPRKQSLANPGASPFVIVTEILEDIPNDLEQLSFEQINSITEPIISIGQYEEVMSLAKDASQELFSDLSASERVNKINELLTKLRLALDSETANHSKLLETNPYENSIIKSTSVEITRSQDESEEAGPSNRKEEMARLSIELGKSEERVQALSVIMLYLCTGLQHAQGVASQ